MSDSITDAVSLLAAPHALTLVGQAGSIFVSEMFQICYIRYTIGTGEGRPGRTSQSFNMVAQS
jgi:hypothetical protein